MNRFYLIFAFLLGLFTNNVLADEWCLAPKEPDTVVFQNLIDIEKKILFLKNEDDNVSLLIKKSEIYKEIGDYHKSLLTLERIQFSSISDSLKSVVYSQLSLLSFLTEYYQQSVAYADLALLYRGYNKDFDSMSEIVKILSLNELEDYQYAYLSGIEHINNNFDNNEILDVKLKEWELLYSQKSIPKFKKPSKAETMSAIIPGMGQMYSGFYWEGMTNLGIHLVLLGGTAFAVYKTYYLTSYFAGAAVFIRFYQGGIRRSEYLAHKRNYLEKRKFNDNVKENILGKKEVKILEK